ncbi:DUF6464 family protein [uncultured Nostoc sp.]|uniref:DUF6464 family protein n=1 Tax=uncultured Nostoc sp. TaxID=340711 RepID=UPI0035CAE5DC
MKKIDWFTLLGAIAITENTVCMIAQGGWLAVAGLVFGGIWVWVAYWEWKRYQTIKNDHKEAILSFLNPGVMRYEDDTNNISPSGIDFEAIEAAYSALLASRDEPRFIGDVTCKNNARSPYLQCAINPRGECQDCKDYEAA